MKIDNRILVPFAMPFALLFVTRAVFFLAGAEWSDPWVAAAMCIVFGAIIGLNLTVCLFCEKVSLGHTTIGRSKDDA